MRKHMRFDTQLTAADWNETTQAWDIKTGNADQVLSAKYLVTCLGLLSKQNIPDM